LERYAPDDLKDNRREAVLIPGRIAHNSANGWHVSARQSAANRVSHELFGQGPDEGLGLPQQGGAKLDDPIYLCTVHELA
jgi:hypothetical protein